MTSAQFTIQLGDGKKRVSAKTLARALENAIDMLRNLESELAPSGTNLVWEVIHASMRSPLTITLSPRTANGKTRLVNNVGRKIVAASVKGIRSIERAAALPPHFNEEAARAVQSLVEEVEKDGANLTISSDKRNRVSPTQAAVSHVKEIVLRSRRYIDYGTIEGRLEEVSVHGGSHFNIWEDLTNQKVKCDIPHDKLEEAKSKLEQRVIVSGLVHYSNHKPISIAVEDFQRIRDVSELPQLEDMPPIDITGDLSSEEYVRRLRDAQ